MYYRKMARDLYKLIEIVYSEILPFFNVSKICTFQQKNIDLHVAEIINKLCIFLLQPQLYVFSISYSFLLSIIH